MVALERFGAVVEGDPGIAPDEGDDAFTYRSAVEDEAPDFSFCMQRAISGDWVAWKPETARRQW